MKSKGRHADRVAALIAAYQGSPEWARLKPHTQVGYGIYLRELAPAGHLRVSDVRRRDILLVRDGIASERGAAAANMFTTVVSLLFRWAVDREWLDIPRPIKSASSRRPLARLDTPGSGPGARRAARAFPAHPWCWPSTPASAGETSWRSRGPRITGSASG